MAITIKSKIVVIGAGNVGEAIGYTLMLRRQASDIVLVDLNEKRAKGSALDIAHGTAFSRQSRIRMGGYEECADAEAIIITAGVARKPGQTRLDLAKINVGIIRSITENIMRYADNPLIVVVSNPVDISTYIVQQTSGLPANRVIGTGTSLDTARFRYLLSEACKVDVCDINAYVLGEHGDSQVAIWSSAAVGGEPILDFINRNNIVLDQDTIAQKAKDSGAKVISLKGATFYGIAMTTSHIVEALLTDENSVLPVAHVLDSSFGALADVAVSLPCVLNRTGIARVMSIPMSDQERAAVEASAKTLRDFLNSVLND